MNPNTIPGERLGPHVKIIGDFHIMVCTGCKFLRVEYENRENQYCFCSHPNFKDYPLIGFNPVEQSTPKECPFIKPAVTAPGSSST